MLSRVVLNKAFAGAACALAFAGTLAAQPYLGSQPQKTWAWSRAAQWRVLNPNAGQQRYLDKGWKQLSYAQQTEELLRRVKSDSRIEYISAQDRRAALILLGERPLGEWAVKALAHCADRAEVATFLFHRGFRMSGAEPYGYMGNATRLDRPWTHGLGLHLTANNGWRMQWVPSPVLLPVQEGQDRLPPVLRRAAQPGVLIHLRQLRPGLQRLRALAGPGEGGLVGTLTQGTRAGFLLSHLEPWFKQASPALEAMADREAWILHYGLSREDEGAPGQGTLVFIPGDLPTRAKLMTTLLSLNPFSRGPRTQTATWTDGRGGKVQVQQFRASGGVLHMVTLPEGTFLSDREAPLRAFLFSGPHITLGERGEWLRVALGGMQQDAEVSFWLTPRIGAGVDFERVALLRRAQGLRQNTWPNPSMAKSAPRVGGLSVSLGAGPTELLVESVLRVDNAEPLQEPRQPVFTQGSRIMPEAQKAYDDEMRRVQTRRQQRGAVRKELDALKACLDLRGAALHWRGWVNPPALGAAERKALQELQRLRKTSPAKAARMQHDAEVKAFGGFGEPGMTPSLALALPLKAGQRGAAEAALGRLWPTLFRGRAQRGEKVGAAELHRVVTDQAFRPCFAFSGDTLVLGSDDEAVKAVVQGLQGQAPTLADLPPLPAYGLAEVDGAQLAAHLEQLLLAYLRSRGGGPTFWWMPPEDPTTADEAAAQVAGSFGPFLGALKGLGKVELRMDWSPWGLELRPR